MSQEKSGLTPDKQRETRIESLRRQIAAGTYGVSSTTLARAILDRMQGQPVDRAA